VKGSAGLADLREAEALLAGTASEVELVRTRIALARRPEVADEDAVSLLRQAVPVARRHGAGGLVRDALTALAQRGVVDEDDERVALSRAERQVLELTAAGLSVREVAERLFLTPGVVQTTLAAAAPA
jgi:DNA-binding NarL/FixJ family response regulator